MRSTLRFLALIALTSFGMQLSLTALADERHQLRTAINPDGWELPGVRREPSMDQGIVETRNTVPPTGLTSRQHERLFDQPPESKVEFGGSYAGEGARGPSNSVELFQRKDWCFERR